MITKGCFVFWFFLSVKLEQGFTEPMDSSVEVEWDRRYRVQLAAISPLLPYSACSLLPFLVPCGPSLLILACILWIFTSISVALNLYQSGVHKTVYN